MGCAAYDIPYIENHFTFVLKKTAVDASVTPVIGWIKKGWLKATQRGDTIADHGGPGDRWNITPKAVRAFLLENAALINPRGINFVWLMDYCEIDDAPLPATPD